jgi:soluble lytic murein transglycosylase
MVRGNKGEKSLFRRRMRIEYWDGELRKRMTLERGLRIVAILAVALCSASRAGAAPLSDSDRQIYAGAFAAAKHDDWAGAQRIAAAARDQLPATFLRWLQLMHPTAGASFADITAFADEHQEWPGQKQLRQRAEDALATATDAQAEVWFSQHPPLSPTARLREAGIWTDAGHPDDAARLIRQAWVEGHFSAVEEKLMLERYHDVLRGEDNARRLDQLIWDGQYDEAKHMINHVGPETAALDQARLALAQMRPGIDGLVARVPAQLQNDPGLLFERMRWRRHKDLDDEAADIVEHAPANLPHPDAWSTERLILARRLLDDNQAQRAFNLAAHNGLSSGPIFAELEFLAGWIALRELNQPDIAYNHFVRLYGDVKLPISLARGAYWAARAADAMGQPQTAATWYGIAAPQITTYYGQLAAAHLGDAETVSLKEPTTTPEENAAFERNELVRLARDLAQLGDSDDLPPFLRRIADAAQTQADYVLAARLARSLDRPDIAVTAAKHASYAGVTLIDEGYPVADLPAGGNIEAPLVLAMTRQESAFDRGAISGAGALGMMQLMPATASKIAKGLNLPFSRERLTTDLAYNVTIGRAYLDSLVGDFSGSYVLAIAAYNAGPARVHQWMQDHGDPRAPEADVVDWIERIPYTETRNYVQRVMENLQIYRMRLGAHQPSLSLAGDLKR